jgi:hypothetical protein
MLDTANDHVRSACGGEHPGQYLGQQNVVLALASCLTIQVVSILMEVLNGGTIGESRPHKLNLSSRYPYRPQMMCSVYAAGWNPKRTTVGLSARISTNACPMSCKTLLIDLYEPNPRSCLMTSRDSMIRANCDLALTWPPIRYLVIETMLNRRPPASFAGRSRHSGGGRLVHLDFCPLI